MKGDATKKELKTLKLLNSLLTESLEAELFFSALFHAAKMQKMLEKITVRQRVWGTEK